MKCKRILLAIAAFILMTSGVASAQKIGYVNLSYLFDEYDKTKEYDTVLESDHNDFEKKRNDKIEKINELQARVALSNAEKKAELEEEIETMKAELLEFDRQKKTDLTKKRNEKIQEILLEIEKIVSDYAKKEGYSIILNDRVLIYADDAVNLTEDILGVLNAKKK